MNNKPIRIFYYTSGRVAIIGSEVMLVDNFIFSTTHSGSYTANTISFAFQGLDYLRDAHGVCNSEQMRVFLWSNFGIVIESMDIDVNHHTLGGEPLTAIIGSISLYNSIEIVRSTEADYKPEEDKPARDPRHTARRRITI